jgi:hypothetical protein
MSERQTEIRIALGMLFFTFVLAAANSIYVYTSDNQLTVMQGQLDEIKKQSDAALRSAKAAEAQHAEAQLVDSPRLVVRDFVVKALSLKPTGTGHISITHLSWKNTGKRVALNPAITAFAYISSDGSKAWERFKSVCAADRLHEQGGSFVPEDGTTIDSPQPNLAFENIDQIHSVHLLKLWVGTCAIYGAKKEFKTANIYQVLATQGGPDTFEAPSDNPDPVYIQTNYGTIEQ